MSEAAAAVYLAPSELVPWNRNPRQNDAAVEHIANSIQRFGFASPIVARKEDLRVIAGHTRLRAALSLGLEQVPVRLLDVSEQEADALALADNKLGEIADWDDDALAEIMAGLDDLDVDLDGLGWSDDELAALPEYRAGAEEPEDEAPEVRPDAVSEVGVVYELGPHRVMCGDSTDPMDVAILMGKSIAILYHSDPPYGMGKEGEGVANDNLYRDKLDAFLTSTWMAWRPHLEDNASAYMWGNAEDLWRWWWLRMQDGEVLSLRNEIVWDKGGGHGMRSGDIRSYPIGSERCLFWMLGKQEPNTNAAQYWQGWEPIRSWLAGEVTRMGWTSEEIKKICGVRGGMPSHWFSKSQWGLITEKHYAALQGAAGGLAFVRTYASIREEYGPLADAHQRERDAFYATRAYFDNTHDTMRDVWEFPRVHGADREGHATPKPVSMMQRIVRSSTPEGALVVEPFGGSGSTLMGCAAAGRVCYTMELMPEWVDVIRRRWTKYATDNGVDPGPGALR